MTTLNIGDKVKILSTVPYQSARGKNGIVVNISDTYSDQIFVIPAGENSSLPLYAHEVEKVGPKLKYRVGDTVRFLLEGWEKAEGVVVKAKPDEYRYYPYEVKLTVEPGNDFHKVGQVSFWRENMLNLARPTDKFKSGDRVTVVVDEVKDWRNINGLSGEVQTVWSRGQFSPTVYYVVLDNQPSRRLIIESELKKEEKPTKFKVGDKVYVHNASEGFSFKGKCGSVESVSPETLTSTGETLYHVRFTDNDHTPLIRESALEFLPELKFAVGDKVRTVLNEFWYGGEGVVKSIDPTGGNGDYYYNVEITKVPEKNVVQRLGNVVSLCDREIEKIEKIDTVPELTEEDLDSAELGDVVQDADGDLWVAIGFGHFAFKGAENELELNTAEALHENYSPLIEWNK